ncbi:MAG: hypothetical protein OEZ36_10670 [Spirochaetota bacterium]|nr:hypothetical protein [Spirochaetota bacterium]
MTQNDKSKQPKDKKIIVTPASKKIIINSGRKKQDLSVTEVKSEGDFIKKISGLLKSSSRCDSCHYLKINSNKEYSCTDFEALWYHRDNEFSKFDNCTYHKVKEKSTLNTAS